MFQKQLLFPDFRLYGLLEKKHGQEPVRPGQTERTMIGDPCTRNQSGIQSETLILSAPFWLVEFLEIAKRKFSYSA